MTDLVGSTLPLVQHEGPETSDWGLAPAQFDLDVIENNFWGLRQNRLHDRRNAMLGDISLHLYGDAEQWKSLGNASAPMGLPASTDPRTIPGSSFQQPEDAAIDEMFAALDRVREQMPGEVANLPTSYSELMAIAEDYTRSSLQSEFVLRASGLTAWTDIGRGVFKLEFYGLLAENAGRSWDELDAPLRDLVFKARGITPDEWDIIRATPLHRDAADPEASFLIPDDIRRRGDLDPDGALDLSLKLGSAVQEMVEFAVPSASLRGRATLQVGKPGTLGGEFLNSVLMYKNFPLSMMFNQLGRVLYKKVNGSRGANMLMFGLITTVAGSLSLQVKEMLRGRDPRDMTTGQFWKAAMLQGGGLGIFGDFIYAAENRFGNSLEATAAGPMVALGSKIVSLTGHIATALTSGDPEKVDKAQREAVRFIDQFGGPTNLWPVAAAVDRWIWDGLTDWLDPDAGIARDRAEKRRIRDYGNAAYWPPGSPLPTRWPDITNMIGGAP